MCILLISLVGMQYHIGIAWDPTVKQHNVCTSSALFCLQGSEGTCEPCDAYMQFYNSSSSAANPMQMPHEKLHYCIRSLLLGVSSLQALPRAVLRSGSRSAASSWAQRRLKCSTRGIVDGCGAYS